MNGGRGNDYMDSYRSDASGLLSSESEYETEESHQIVDEDEDGGPPPEDPNKHSPIRSFILLAALSLHSVFEGLAVGLQETEQEVCTMLYL